MKPEERALRLIVRRVRYSVKRRETRFMKPEEYEPARMFQTEWPEDIVDRIAERAGCDWLMADGIARFFEGN